MNQSIIHQKDKTIDTIRYCAISYNFDHNKSLRNYKDISKSELKYRAINNWRTRKFSRSIRNIAIPNYANTLRLVTALRKFFTIRRYPI